MFNGDIKTHKEYKELERRLKLKDQALEAVKQTKTTEKIIVRKQLLGKNKDLADELDSVKRS